ncbi:MAG: alpha/beta hydrolase [Acidimicrobiia bacterium]|nr:alpha/beta hydrolase [Acidimicrobiia bacterium]
MAASRFHGAIHTVDHGGSGRPMILVHGLGGSHVNWSQVAPRLCAHAEVLAIDLPGFGLSAPARHGDLEAHVEALRSVAGAQQEPATLIGNSMGGLVAMMLAALHPDLVSELVLVSPAAPLPRFAPPPSPRIAAQLLLQSMPGVGAALTNAYRTRLTPAQQVHLALSSIAVQPVSPDAIDEAVDLARIRSTYPWVGRAFSESAASVRSWLMRPGKYMEMARSIDKPTLVVWGDRDPVVSPRALESLLQHRPDWQASVFAGVGHVPQLETPVRFVDTVIEWLSPVGVSARK